MQKRNVFAIGIVVLCTAGAFGYYSFNRPHEGTQHLTPSSTTAAATLFAAYQADEQKANGEFLGKVIQVNGRVAEVSPADSAGSLVLGTGGGGGINCSFGPETPGALKNIHPGDSVSCKGRCTGFLMDVNLSDCVLLPITESATK